MLLIGPPIAAPSGWQSSRKSETAARTGSRERGSQARHYPRAGGHHRAPLSALLYMKRRERALRSTSTLEMY